jgi:hypothetical protein
MNQPMTFKTLFLLFTTTLVAACTVVDSSPEEGEGEGNDAIADDAEDDCEVEGDSAKCEDGEGVTTCVADDDGNLVWSDCAISECADGDTEPCGQSGMRSCVVDDSGVGTWGECQAGGSSVTTPLVLSFDDGPVVFTTGDGAFSIDPKMSVATDWVSEKTPWLALDRNENGVIDDGSELFGSASVLASGELASHGFLALAELDVNRDGAVTPADPAFSRLSAWVDADQDRVTDPGELVALADLGVESLSVGYDVVRRCDARDNCQRETSAMSFRSASGEVVAGRVIDVYLAHR